MGVGGQQHKGKEGRQAGKGTAATRVSKGPPSPGATQRPQKGALGNLLPAAALGPGCGGHRTDRSPCAERKGRESAGDLRGWGVTTGPHPFKFSNFKQGTSPQETEGVRERERERAIESERKRRGRQGNALLLLYKRYVGVSLFVFSCSPTSCDQIHSMPTLGPTTGPHQWESFHLGKRLCLVCSDEILLHYIH
jgi:hypothetical protein